MFSCVVSNAQAIGKESRRIEWKVRLMLGKYPFLPFHESMPTEHRSRNIPAAVGGRSAEAFQESGRSGIPESLADELPSSTRSGDGGPLALPILAAPVLPPHRNVHETPRSPEIRPQSAPSDLPLLQRLPGRLAAVTSYFNPCGYRSLRQNYRRFAQGMHAQGVPLYTAELAFGDKPFVLDGGPYVRQFRARDVLWHKERLLNLLLPHVPPEFDKIAWIDADLLFDNADWSSDAGRRLEEYPVVQLFEQAVYSDAQGRPFDNRTSVARAVDEGRPNATDLGSFHPGFAWAARRTLLERHGLPDDNILGDGDSMMVCAMFGWWNHPLIARSDWAMRESILAWGQSFREDVQGHVGWVPGRILHLWHGNSDNRRYVERMGWLGRAGFDPRRDLRAGADGLWEWTGGQDWLRERIRQYFFDRREDEQ